MGCQQLNLYGEFIWGISCCEILKMLTKEVKSALSKFKKDKAAGKLTPFNDTDVKNWL